ncbi:ARF GAP with effector function(s) [Marasmius crinis-equi]|uniref:ARF GAP with effector function(S) n=1 Tax=Marasmius crinis-equi TaxID=585013 RepID=A0ABR3FNQ8_9AGAR
MESIQKWGNRLANLYWESHLRAGHVPPDHKMESFIRSKYESRRWAMEGPPPADPSVLDNGQGQQSQAAEPPAPAPQVSPPPSASTPARHAAPPVTNRQPQGHQLLSAGLVGQQHSRVTSNPAQAAPAPVQAAPAPPPAQAPENDLFSLDFHTPTSASPVNNTSASQAPKKDVKQDILSLFSTPPAQAAPAMGAGMGQFGGMPAQNSPWASAPPANQPAAQPTSMMGTSGAGMWGASSGWTGNAMPAQQNVWGAPSPPATQQQPNLFASSNDVWGGSAGAGGGAQQDPFGSFTAPSTTAQKKDDVFGDIWGGFK